METPPRLRKLPLNAMCLGITIFKTVTFKRLLTYGACSYSMLQSGFASIKRVFVIKQPFPQPWRQPECQMLVPRPYGTFQ